MCKVELLFDDLYNKGRVYVRNLWWTQFIMEHKTLWYYWEEDSFTTVEPTVSLGYNVLTEGH